MTNNCPSEQKLSAYHDGELPADERDAVARHLAWCAACARQLQHLGQVSGLFASFAPDGLSQIAWHRLHAKLDNVIERGLIRWAWEVSGVAAAILLIGSVCLMRMSDPRGETAGASTNTTVNATAVVPPWVNAQASADPVVSESTTPAGAWYLADARNASDAAP